MKHLLKLVSAGLLIAGAISGVVRYTHWLRVVQVECSLAGSDCPPQLETVVKDLRGQPMLFTDVEAQVAQDQAYETFVLASATRLLPSTLRLEFRLLDPTVTVSDATTADSQQWWISPQGTLKPSPKLGKHVVVLGEQLRIDQPQHEWQRLRPKLLELAASLDQLELQPSKVVVIDQTTFRLETATTPPMLGSLTDSWQSLARMELLSNSPEFQPFDPAVTLIDARFKLPVLKSGG
ncbi:MAG: hypothetical protein COU69_01865 [Candidatus Pacebacteria bacterium CG10_big_fil_rev_8_21_14_0_10_56_10]|nr:MAG: hypothetical protein COU69_01865 [Candidatus Pacebacteria bacterium CG10_big_fil_rev_8_21_14_0_10_56_10]